MKITEITDITEVPIRNKRYTVRVLPSTPTVSQLFAQVKLVHPREPSSVLRKRGCIPLRGTGGAQFAEFSALQKRPLHQHIVSPCIHPAMPNIFASSGSVGFLDPRIHGCKGVLEAFFQAAAP